MTDSEGCCEVPFLVLYLWLLWRMFQFCLCGRKQNWKDRTMAVVSAGISYLVPPSHSCLLLHLFTYSIANGKIVISFLWEWGLISHVPSIAEEWARFAGSHQNVCLQPLLFCDIPQFMNYSKWIVTHMEWPLSQQSCQVTGCISPRSIHWKALCSVCDLAVHASFFLTR